MDEISLPTYTPSDQDILHCRVKTNGIVEVHFSYKGLDFRYSLLFLLTVGTDFED